MTNPRQHLRLAGHICIVTGGASGIGRAEAVTLARQGARVLCADIGNTGDVVAEIRDSGGTAHGWQGDITQPGAAEDVLGAALKRFGDVTVLINNAGIVRDRMVFNLEDEDWDAVLAVNLTAPFRLSRAVARHWRLGTPPAGGRRIINTSSESGLYGNAGQTNYAAAKSGITGLTLALAAELERYGVRVNAIAPRARTPMSDAALPDLAPATDDDPLAPSHVAEFVGWLIGPGAREITGQVFVVSGQTIQWLQGWLIRKQTLPATESGQLKRALFGDENTRNIPAPISALFAHHETAEAQNGVH